jgi:DNA-binding HxlR family transcriptional regulator
VTTAQRFVPVPIDDDHCRRATSLLEFVGRRWTSSILLALGRGATRFGQIQASVTGISARMLSVRLKELERHRLVHRVVHPTVPVSVEYHLTERGAQLLALVDAVAQSTAPDLDEQPA